MPKNAFFGYYLTINSIFPSRFFNFRHKLIANASKKTFSQVRSLEHFSRPMVCSWTPCNPLPSQLPSLFPSPFPSPLCNVNFSHFKIYKVLQAKLRRQNDLKRKLGITQLDEIKSDINVTLKTISESDAFVKTSSTLKTAGQKTGEVLSVAGQKTGEVLGSASVSLKGKLGEMRNSPSFQSFGSSVNNTWTSLKRQASTTMRTSQSANDVNGAAAGAGIIENGREPEELIKGD